MGKVKRRVAGEELLRLKQSMRRDTYVMREDGWGKTSPADFWDAGEERTVTNRKWWPWTAANDLAGKDFMKNGDYLVRCAICKDEKYQTSGVYLCPKDECKNAVAILIELGYDNEWAEIADKWYTSWYEEEPKPSTDLAFAQSINDSAQNSVRQALAEPTTEGG